MAIEFGTITSSSIQWRITGLSNPFREQYYMEAGGAMNSFTNGQASEPAYSFNWVDAPVSNTVTYTPWMTRTGLSPNTTYNFYAWARAANGLYYQSGALSAVTAALACGIPGPVYADRLTPTANFSSLYCYWGASSTSNVTYQLEYTDLTGGGTNTVTTLNTYYTLTGLTGGHSYSLRVRATRSGYTSSSYTSANSARTLPCVPPSVSTQSGSITDSSIRVYVGTVSGGIYTGIRVRLYNSSETILLSTLLAPIGTSSVNFTGLSPNTSYKINSETYHTVSGTTLYSSDNASTEFSDIGRSSKQSYTTLYAVPSAPSISFSSRTTASLSFTRGTSSGATSYNSYLEGSLYATGIGTGFTISGLAAGYSYSVGVAAVNESGTSSINSITRATLCNAPTLSHTGTTATSLTFTRGSVTGAASYYVYLDGNYWGTAPSTSFTVTGLNPNTSYTVGIGAVNADGAVSASTSLTRTTLSDRPDNWTGFDWIVSGANFYDYNSSTSTGYPITAVSWNSFTSRINEFRTYKSLSSYSFTTVSSGTSFSATYINQAITAINAMGFSQSAVTSGTTTISASIFQTMKNNLNSIYI